MIICSVLLVFGSACKMDETSTELATVASSTPVQEVEKIPAPTSSPVSAPQLSGTPLDTASFLIEAGQLIDATTDALEALDLDGRPSLSQLDRVEKKIVALKNRFDSLGPAPAECAKCREYFGRVFTLHLELVRVWRQLRTLDLEVQKGEKTQESVTAERQALFQRAEKAGEDLQQLMELILAEAEPLASSVDARVESAVELGKQKFRQEDFKGAIDEFDKAISLFPLDANNYSLRALAKSALKDYEGAAEDYDKAISLNPKDPDFYFDRGRVKLKLKDYQGEIDDYTDAIKLKPDDGAFYRHRGDARESLEDYKGATEDYDKAIKLNPEDAESYYFRGSLKNQLGDIKGAIEDYNKAIEIIPDDADFYFDRGSAKGLLQDYEGSADDLTKAIELDPDDPEKYAARAAARAGSQGFESAIEDLSKAIELDPNNVEYYRVRALVFKETGKVDKAKADEVKVAELEND